MSKLFFLLTLILSSQLVWGQSPVLQYEYKITDFLNVKKSSDTIRISRDMPQTISIKIDSSGLPPNIRYEILYSNNQIKDTVTKSIGTKKFQLTDQKFFRIEFFSCQNKTKKTVKYGVFASDGHGGRETIVVDKKELLLDSILKIHQEGKSTVGDTTFETSFNFLECNEPPFYTIVFEKNEREFTPEQKAIQAQVEKLDNKVTQLLKQKQDSAHADLTVDLSRTFSLYSRVYVDKENEKMKGLTSRMIRRSNRKVLRQLRKEKKDQATNAASGQKTSAGTETEQNSSIPPVEAQNSASKSRTEALSPKSGDIVPDSTIYYFYKKTGKRIALDSMSMQISDGYITNVSLFIDSTLAEEFKLNRVTVANKFIDLRSTKDAGEEINLFLPLESIYRRYKPGGIGKTFGPGRAKEPARNIVYSNLFFNLNDIVRYFPNIDSIGDVLVHVKNKNLTFTPTSAKRVRLSDKEFSSFAQLNIFSDLIGLAENEPNGILQIEGKFEAGLFTQPLWNSRYYSRVKFNILPSACLSVGINKIEKKLRYLPVETNDVYLSENGVYSSVATPSVKNVKTIKLLQFSSLDVSAKANFLKFESDYANGILYGGVGLVRTPISDSIKGKDAAGNEVVEQNNKVYNSLKWFYGTRFKFKCTSKLGFEVGLEALHLRLNNSTLLQTYAYYDNSKKREIVKESLSGSKILMSSLQIYYLLNREQSNRLYLRVNYYISQETKTDEFFAFQLGYSADLKQFFKLFSTD